MPDSQTPSPERAPDGPPHLNGSIKGADTAVASLLHDQPAETGTDTRNGTAHVDVDTPTEDLDVTSSAPPSVAHGGGAQAAEESPASHGVTEPTQSDEAGNLAGEPERELPAPAGRAGPEPDQEDKLGSSVRASVVTGGRALLERRGLRPTVLGVALAILGLVLGASSLLSVSLLVLGLVMLIVGLMGPRLQGRFAVEFGPNGATIEIQTHMAPPRPARPAAALALWKPIGALSAAGGEIADQSTDNGTNPAIMLGEIIQAQGETIELDVKGLKALLAGPPHDEYMPA